MNHPHFRNPKLSDLLLQAVDVKLTLSKDLMIEKLFVKFSDEENNLEIPQFKGKLLTECTNLDLVKELRDLLIIADKEKKPQMGTITIASLRNMKVFYDLMPIGEGLFFLYMQVHQPESINNQYQFIKDLFISLGNLGTLTETGDLLVSQLARVEPSNGYGMFILDEHYELIYKNFSADSINDRTQKLFEFIKDRNIWQLITNGVSITVQKENNAYRIFDKINKEFTTLYIQPILYKGSLIGVYFLFARSVLPPEFSSFLEDFSFQSGIILAGIRDYQLLTTRMEQLEKVLGSLESFLFIISNQGSPVYCSSSFRKNMGLLPVDHPLPNILDMVVPGQIEKFKNFLGNSTTEFLAEENIIFITDKGERKSISLQVRKLETKNEILYIFKESPDSESLGVDLSIPFQHVNEVTSKLPIPVFLIDELSFKIILANTSAYELFQYPFDDLANKNFLELFSPSENINLINTVKTTGLKNLESEYYWSMEKNDGSSLKTRLFISSLKFQNKRLLLVTFRDGIMETSSTSIRESKSDYLVNDDYPLFCKVAPDGILLQANQAYCDLFGKPIDRIVGMPLQGYVFMEDYEQVLQHLSQLTPEQRVKKNISRVVNSKGEIKYIEWIDSAQFHEGNLVEISAVGRDITSEYKLDLLRKSMEQRYQALVENLPFVISVFHTQTSTPIYISPQILKITGFSQEEFYSNPNKSKELIHPDDWELFSNYFDIVMMNKTHPPFEFRFFKIDGSIGWGEASGTTITLADQTTLFQGFFRDVTGRHFAREKLRYYSNFEKLIIEFSLKFINADEKTFYPLLSDVIGELGKFMNVDRSYVFDLDHRSKTMSNTFEWCKEGIKSMIQNLQNIPFSMAPWWIERLNQNLEIAYDDIEEMPFSSDQQRQMFTLQGIKSLLVVPVFFEGKPQGFIGFDMVEESTHWEPEAINLLRIVSSLIASTFRKFN